MNSPGLSESYIEILNKTSCEISSLPQFESMVDDLNILTEDINSRELLIPVIGMFSSGKSTLINSVIKRKILPVAMTPKTSLATEIRYDSNERIEAVNINAECHNFKIENINEIFSNAEKYKYIRLYVNNDIVKSLEPYIIVDMPGYESTVDIHNRAIVEYLNRGCRYIAVIDITDGTVNRRCMSKLHEIKNSGKNFSVYLTKSDLKPESAIKEVRDNISNLLENEFGEPVSITVVSRDNCDCFADEIEAIDQNDLFRNLYRNPSICVLNNIINSIDIRLNALSKNINDLEQAVKELNYQKDRIERETESNAQKIINNLCSPDTVANILTAVRNNLNGSVDEIAAAISAGNSSQAESIINDIVRMTLTEEMNSTFSQIKEQIMDNMVLSLSSIDSIMKNMELDNQFISNLCSKVEKAFDMIKPILENKENSVGKIAGQIVSNQALNLGYKAVTGVGTTIATGIGASAGAGTIMAAAGTGIGIAAGAFALPVLGIALMFLPEILHGMADGKHQKMARSRVLMEVFPQVTRNLRTELNARLKENAQYISQSVMSSCKDAIATKIQDICTAIESRNSDKQSETETQQQLSALKSRIAENVSELAAL